jgi:prepilin-type N-terminal cleavage/methylation domain-containing protein
MFHTQLRFHGTASDLDTRRQAGFSLVELLVVVAIISTLVGLLLPAVQSARESGRRTSCANNVRQLATACQQHVEAQGHFPTGGWGQEWGGDPDAGFGSKQSGGWHYALLPYIDQSALRNDGAGQDDTGKAAAARRAYETQVGTFACPTRGVSAPVPVSGSYRNSSTATFTPAVAGRSDYAANGGDVVSAAMVDQAVTASATEQNILAMPGSAAGSVAAAGNDKATGVVFRGSMMRPAHLRDGMSNVYLLGERFIQRGQSQTSSSMGNQHGWLVGFDDDSIRFTNSLPSGDDDSIDPSGSGFEGRFGGGHSGVFPMAMADGSVHMLPFEIDLNTHQRLGNRRDGQVAMLPTN